jgi:type II secretory ATPase GspE/PulE/Tfp pilus assembly ATPase PilB-like protein
MASIEQILLDMDLITEDDVEEAELHAKKKGLKTHEALIELEIITYDDYLFALGQKLQMPVVDLHNEVIEPRLLKLVPAEFSRRNGVIPVAQEDGVLIVAFKNPDDAFLLVEELSFMVSMRVQAAVADPKAIERAIEDSYGAAERLEKEEAIKAEFDEEVDPEADEGLIRLVNQIIVQAQRRNVSDIHIEPYPEADVVVRFRADGVCYEFMKLPRQLARSVLARLKVMANLDISEKRLPQDGKIKFKDYGPLDLELRVATLPTTGGVEDCVMRLLAASEPLPLDKMGFMPDVLKRFYTAIVKPYGLVLVCGPTGSGKTTTLHSALGYINTPERKIWTAEDPVEITQRGLRQVQVQAKIGLTFSRALRAFLRADPDVIMIGEMRDHETAEAGIEASLTGHMVFSTLHTNSAPETVTRLLDMGIDRFAFGDSLLGVLAQRLMRRLCKDCKQARRPDPGEPDALRTEFGSDLNWKRLGLGGQMELYGLGPGCEVCANKGYKGRIGIHEFMDNNDQMRELIYAKALVSQISKQAESDGMTTLKQDGIRKVMLGHSDVNEVRRVCIK